tara:strand:- start:2233 stop:2712 length:480 start_codon:yes stop_codon:yes gene_type:complete
MAIRDTSRKPYIVDNDTNVSIGLDLPIRKGDDKQGYFASTYTTIEAVKVNIRNLLNTHQGERLMQPTFGIDLRKYLFEQVGEESVLPIQDSILDVLSFWLPFVEVRNIEIATNNDDLSIGVNSMILNIVFNIKQDPNTLDSVQVTITNTGEQTDNNTSY